MIRIDRLDAILDQIHVYPWTHSQREYATECGTAFCIAGWAIAHRFGVSEATKIILEAHRTRELIETADQWLGLDTGFNVSRDHPLFHEALDLEDIVEQRNIYAAQQGLPAYIPPAERQDFCI